MLVYRVFPHLPHASAGDPGSPEYLHRPQGTGRIDNPTVYDSWYFSADSSAAVGETFGSIAEWSDAMFEFPKLAGSRRALGVFHLPDGTPILDLDDPLNLSDRRLRPTKVISRNRRATQQWALSIHNESMPAGGAKVWNGVQWWSYYSPEWRVLGLWSAIPRCIRVEPLSVGHPAVIDASISLSRILLP